MPYWWHLTPWFSGILHGFLILCFALNLKPKFTTLGLFIVEYCLVVRMGLMVHGGHLLFLIMLLILTLEDWLPEMKKWVASGIWVIQFSLVYFFTGLYKNFDLWFTKGEALQSFINLESQNNGVVPLSLGVFGDFFSKLIIPLEIIFPLVLIVSFFLKRPPKKLIVISLLVLSCVHIGSFFLFSIFTFPFIGMLILYGIYCGIQNSEHQNLKIKFLVFFIILPIHLLPYFNLATKELRILPLWNKWTFFSRLPPVKGGEVEVQVLKKKDVIYSTKLNDSFHWTRYRFMVDSDYPTSKETRMEFNVYLCRKYQADEILWLTPSGPDLHYCLIK